VSFHLGNRSGKTTLHYRVTFGVHPRASCTSTFLSDHERRTDEAELTSEGKQPFTLQFVLHDKVGRFTIQEALPGAPIAAVKKYADTLIALRDGGQIELYDLDEERVLGRFQNGTDVIPCSTIPCCA